MRRATSSGGQVAADDFFDETYEQDRAYRNDLIQIFGSPYAGTIGSGLAYPAGYNGPDLNLWFYVDVSEVSNRTVPAGSGTFAAAFSGFKSTLWLLPTDDHYGAWATSGEIDVMENKGHQPRTVSGALHFGGTWPANKFVNHTVRRGIWQPKFSDEFVIYAIDWQPDRIQWLIDDRVVRERVPEHWCAPAGSHTPYDQRFHLLLNLAVGGHFPGPPADNTRFPAAMEVDWVRVWQ